MKNSIYGDIYANVSYGKSRHFHDERVGFNVDFNYKDLNAMNDFSKFIKQDHVSNGKGLYSVAIGENVVHIWQFKLQCVTRGISKWKSILSIIFAKI